MHQLLSAALLAHFAAAARPALRRRSLIAAAPLTLLRPAHAAEAPRYIEQKVVAELAADARGESLRELDDAARDALWDEAKAALE